MSVPLAAVSLEVLALALLRAHCQDIGSIFFPSYGQHAEVRQQRHLHFDSEQEQVVELAACSVSGEPALISDSASAVLRSALEACYAGLHDLQHFALATNVSWL